MMAMIVILVTILLWSVSWYPESSPGPRNVVFRDMNTEMWQQKWIKNSMYMLTFYKKIVHKKLFDMNMWEYVNL